MFECAVCGYSSENGSEFIEFLDSVRLEKVIEKARARGRAVNKVEFICYKCSQELYSEEVRAPRAQRVVCPKCGEVIEIWF
jgi:hypothetical protein